MLFDRDAGSPGMQPSRARPRRRANHERRPPRRGDARVLTRREFELGLRVLLCLVAAWLLLVGWSLFWFQCDDAYIAFRYVSNSQLGWGYTWNPPPFRRVEGYTSFLWVVLLDAVWRLFGVEPPESANWLALAFPAGSLARGALMVSRRR